MIWPKRTRTLLISRASLLLLLSSCSNEHDNHQGVGIRVDKSHLSPPQQETKIGPAITNARACEIAVKAMRMDGEDPVLLKVSASLLSDEWHVTCHHNYRDGGHRGGGGIVVIDSKSGEVLRKVLYQ